MIDIDIYSYIKLGTPEEMKWLLDYAESLEKHIQAVKEAGRKLDINPMQLAAHDQSKTFIDEFPYYARQFHGDKGDPNGFARAWLHHIHANNHHWQHYIFPDGYTLKGSSLENGVMEMPEKYALEMIADWMGASYVYTNSWDMAEWLFKNIPKIILHSNTAEYVRQTLDALGYADTVNGREFARKSGSLFHSNSESVKESAEIRTVYRIFEGRSGNQLTAKNILEDEIRSRLATGWTLYGSPFCVGGTFGVMRGDMWTYSQAMIKKQPV